MDSFFTTLLPWPQRGLPSSKMLSPREWLTIFTLLSRMQSMQRNKKLQLWRLCPKKSKSMTLRLLNFILSSLNLPFYSPGVRECPRKKFQPSGRSLPKKKASQKEEDLPRSTTKRPNSTLHVGELNQRKMRSNRLSWRKRELERTHSKMPETRKNW